MQSFLYCLLALPEILPNGHKTLNISNILIFMHTCQPLPIWHTCYNKLGKIMHYALDGNYYAFIAQQ